MSIIVLEKTKSDRIAKDVATIINALTKCYKDKPETLKKDNYSQIEITLPLNAEVETTIKVVDSILNRRGFAVSQLRIEEKRSFINVLIGITVKSHLALVAKISSTGSDVIIDDSKQEEPMLDFEMFPKDKEEPHNKDSMDMKGTIIYKAPTEKGADKITKILNSIFEESLKTSSTPNKIKVSSEDLITVVLHINEIVYAYGWEITESTIAYIPYIIVERKKPDGVLLPVYNKGTNIYVDEQRLKQHLPKGDLGRFVTCGKSPVRQASPKSPTDKQVGGSHYQLPIQPIEYILANGLGYCEANVVKYVSRWRNKGGIQDLKKAIHYLEMLIEQEEKDASKKS